MNLINEGAHIIDIGGQSTKPNFDDISNELEKNRIKKSIKINKKLFKCYIFYRYKKGKCR